MLSYRGAARKYPEVGKRYLSLLRREDVLFSFVKKAIDFKLPLCVVDAPSSVMNMAEEISELGVPVAFHKRIGISYRRLKKHLGLSRTDALAKYVELCTGINLSKDSNPKIAKIPVLLSRTREERMALEVKLNELIRSESRFMAVIMSEWVLGAAADVKGGLLIVQSGDRMVMGRTPVKVEHSRGSGAVVVRASTIKKLAHSAPFLGLEFGRDSWSVIANGTPHKYRYFEDKDG